jgi:secreted Zn-dependent insulinase-like peptidase
VSLTEQGVQEPDRVLQLIFAYLEMLRREGPREWLYEEQATLAELAFRFREQGSAVGYVSALSSGMHYYAPQDVLEGPYLMDQYKPDMLVEVMDRLRPENALVVFNDESVATDRVSRYYEVPYARAPLGIEAVTLAPDDKAREYLHLPAANEFVAEDVSLVALSDALPEIPTVEVEKARQKVWYMPDDKFRVPKGVLLVKFHSTGVSDTAEQRALTSLYTAVLNDDVNEFSYPARFSK